jgi:hypothetical protein
VEHWCGGRCSGAGHLATVCPIAIIGFHRQSCDASAPHKCGATKCGFTFTTMCISFAIQTDALPASSPRWGS